MEIQIKDYWPDIKLRPGDRLEIQKIALADDWFRNEVEGSGWVDVKIYNKSGMVSVQVLPLWFVLFVQERSK